MLAKVFVGMHAGDCPASKYPCRGPPSNLPTFANGCKPTAVRWCISLNIGHMLTVFGQGYEVLRVPKGTYQDPNSRVSGTINNRQATTHYDEQGEKLCALR